MQRHPVSTFRNAFAQTAFPMFARQPLRGKAWLLLSFGFVLSVKLAVAWIAYALATRDGAVFSTFWAGEWGIQNPDWPLLFHCWDSAWYVRIAKAGYSYPAYAFMPAYPFMIRLANFVTGEWLASSFLVSFLLGMAVVPMFQLLAREYMNENQALTATLLFSFFPPVFFVTSIAYSESLFAVAIVGSWLFCLRKKWVLSAAFAVIATLSRVYGLLITLPLVLRLLKEKRRKMAFLALLFPSLAFLGWNYYLFKVSGDWMALWPAQNHWREGWPFGINSIVRFVVELMATGSRPSPVTPLGVPVAVLWLVVIACIGIPIVASIDVDRDFGPYGVLLFLFLVSFGNVWSLIRFVPFIIPAWLTVRSERRFTRTAVVIASLLCSVVIWYSYVVVGFGH